MVSIFSCTYIFVCSVFTEDGETFMLVRKRKVKPIMVDRFTQTYHIKKPPQPQPTDKSDIISKCQGRIKDELHANVKNNNNIEDHKHTQTKRVNGKNYLKNKDQGLPAGQINSGQGQQDNRTDLQESSKL